MNAQTGTFWYLSQENDIIFPLKTENGDDSLKGIMLLPGDGIAGNVIENGISTIIKDCSKDPRWDKTVDEKTGFKTNTMIAVPFKFGDKTYGCFEIIISYLYSRVIFFLFTPFLLLHLKNIIIKMYEELERQAMERLKKSKGIR